MGVMRELMHTSVEVLLSLFQEVLILFMQWTFKEVEMCIMVRSVQKVPLSGRLVDGGTNERPSGCLYDICSHSGSLFV